MVGFVFAWVAQAASPCPDTVESLPTPTVARLKGPAVIVVDKSARRLMLFANGTRRKTLGGRDACFRVALASGYRPGTKQRQGDLRTPEGWYRTSDRPWSRFYAALTIDYPAERDAQRGLREGLITQPQHDAIIEAQRAHRLPPMNTRLGGQILIHGGGSSSDWTLGCIALDNADIDALRAALPRNLKTDVLVLPDSR
ncbi:MAG: L,D-transpeptidase family protein [Myxococcota bacterium]